MIVNRFFSLVKEGIAQGEHIELRGFGTFGLKYRKPRTAINPKTGQEILVPEHQVPYFKPGKRLKDLCCK